MTVTSLSKVLDLKIVRTIRRFQIGHNRIVCA